MEEQKGQQLDYGRGGRSPKSPDDRDTTKAYPALKDYDQDGKPKSDKPQLSKP